MNEMLKKTLEAKFGDQGETIVKIFDTTQTVFKSNTDSLKKLETVLSNQLNDTTLLGIGKVASMKYALAQKLKEKLENQGVARDVIKNAIRKIEESDEKLIEDAKQEILNRDGRSEALQNEIQGHLQDTYELCVNVIESETRSVDLKQIANTIYDSVQTTLGDIIANSQGLIDTFTTLTSMYVNNVEAQITQIRIIDEKFMSIIESESKDYDQDWFPLSQTEAFSEKVMKNQEEMNVKVQAIFAKIREIDNK